MTGKSGFTYRESEGIPNIDFSDKAELTDQQASVIALTKIAEELKQIRFQLELIDNTVAGK